MREFEIWSEGFAATGNQSGAILHGKQEAGSFPQACRRWFAGRNDGPAYFDPKRLTYWGCKLFDNETDARRSFG